MGAYYWANSIVEARWGYAWRYDSYVKIRRKALDDYVMREVLTPEEDEEVERTVTFKTKNRYNPPPEGLLTHNNNNSITDSLVYNSVGAAQAARSAMLQQLQARQQALRNNPDPYNYGGQQKSLLGGIK